MIRSGRRDASIRVEAAGRLTLPRRTPSWSPQRRARSAAGVELRTAIVLVSIVLPLVVAEGLVVSGELAAGELVHLLALGLLLVGYLVWRREPERRLLLALAPLPIVRILSIALATRLVPEMGWFVIIGVPAFFAVVAVLRVLRLDRRSVGLRTATLGPQLTLAGSGLVLGLPAFLISDVSPLVRDPTLVRLLGAVVVLGVFGGFLEELLFRGLIQTVASQVFARTGVALSCLATALMYAASLNPRYVVFSVLVAAYFGLGVRRTGSILGTSVGHGLLMFTQLVVWPLVLR